MYFSNLLNHPWEVPTQTKFSLEAQKKKKNATKNPNKLYAVELYKIERKSEFYRF